MPAEKDLDPAESMWALFGYELRELRKAAGLTQEALGEKLHSSGGFVGQIETAERRPKPDYVADLDRILGARGRLIRLAHHAQLASLAQPSWFVGYANAESKAQRIRTFEPQVIPGLLQTEEYARELFRKVRMPQAEAEERAARRMTRQSILRHRDPTELWVVLDEGAIVRASRTPGVARSQLEYLLQVCELPNVILEVLPLDAGLHACMDGSMSLLMIPGRAECAYVEWVGDGRLISEASAVQEFARRYELLRADTLSPTKSAQLLRDLVENT
jgi:transcriptional regulator with XRE-family HTH domain